MDISANGLMKEMMMNEDDKLQIIIKEINFSRCKILHYATLLVQICGSCCNCFTAGGGISYRASKAQFLNRFLYIYILLIRNVK